MSAIIVKDMQLTAEDFLRWLPGAVAPLPWRREDGRFLAGPPDSAVTITLEPRPPRRIALLELPVLRVAMAFPPAWTEEARQGFLERFDTAFRRGGG